MEGKLAARKVYKKTEEPQNWGGAPWWSEAGTAAMKHFKGSSGTAHEMEAKKRFREVMYNARKSSCEKAVEELEKAANGNAEIERNIAKQVKQHIRPLRNAARLMKVGTEIIGESIVRRMWPAYFEAQSSLRGPRSPEMILKEIDARTPAPTCANTNDECHEELPPRRPQTHTLQISQ